MRVLRLLLRLFPAGFRAQFGAEMLEQLEREYDAARARGVPAATWAFVGSAVDLVLSATAERWRPTWPYTAASIPGRPPMRPMLHEWTTDLRLAFRALRRSAGFTTVAVGTLGLAIGATAAMFGVVEHVLLRPLPYAHADRLVHIEASAPGSQMPAEFGVSDEFFVHYQERSRLIEDVSSYDTFTSTLRTDDRVERIRMGIATNSLFSTLGARPILGRLPIAADEGNAVVISHELWHSWFAGDSSVVGRRHQIGGGRREIVGVMGPDFRFPEDGALLWIGFEVRPENITVGRFGSPLVARVRPGVTSEQLAAELTALSKELPERFGGSAAYARLIEQHRAVVRTFEEQVLGSASRSLWILFAGVSIVLLIACANVANLFTVRSESRQRELAVRRAIGAARAQLIRLQMAEAIVVAALAGLAAVALASIGLPAFVRAAPEGIPRLADVRLDGATLLFTLGAAVASALACGLVPAIRGSNADLGRIRESGRGSTRRHWGRSGLVVAQTALALVLLIGSGLLLRSWSKLSSVDSGYDTRDLFTFQIAPEGEHLTDGPSYARFAMDFMDRLRALPGVQSVGLVENVPLNEGTASAPVQTEDMTGDATARLDFTWAAGDYFPTMGIAVLQGEPFASRDLGATLGKAVISKSAADLLWPGQNPIGRRLRRQGEEPWTTVIGVVEDVMQDNFRTAAAPLIYLPLVGPTPTSWRISSPAYVIRTARAELIAPDVRALVREVAPSAPMYRVFTMAGLARDSMVQLSFTMLTLGVIAALALVLGAVGLYGVLSYVVSQRTREIGVRIALGAQIGEVRRMVVAQGARVVMIGVAIGLGVALVSTRALDSLLFGVPAIDAATFAAMAVAMVGIGMLASWLPARRASSVDPVESLRSD
jgi:predicted permease